MADTKDIQLKLPPDIAAELLQVAKSVGFKDIESLLKNYVREVIIAARSDAAAQAARANTVASAEDLNVLISPRKEAGSPAS